MRSSVPILVAAVLVILVIASVDCEPAPAVPAPGASAAEPEGSGAGGAGRGGGGGSSVGAPAGAGGGGTGGGGGVANPSTPDGGVSDAVPKPDAAPAPKPDAAAAPKPDAASAAVDAGDASTPDAAAPIDAPAVTEERFASVYLEDAVVGLGKFGMTPWDPGIALKIPASVVTDLAKALGAANPYAAVLGVVAGPVLDGAIDVAQKPDVYGTTRLDVDGQIGTEYWLMSRSERMDNSYTPVFPAGRRFLHVPLDADVRLRVHLLDADPLDADDEVGIAVINAADLRAALRAQTKVEIKVSDQTANQILFIGVSVLPE